LNKVSSIVLLLVLAASQSFSRPSDATDGVVTERKAYTFPSYDKAVETTDVEIYAQKADYEKAVGDVNFEFEKLKYMSDGLKVTAYLYKPKRTEGKSFPTIIFNRGSTVRGDIAPELITFFHRLALEGFVVIAPMLRQSDGGEGRDEVGGADLDDLLNIFPLAKSHAFVDMNNLFMYGESRGGMMTYLALRKEVPVNAAAVFGALTSLQELADAHPKEYSPAFFKMLWPDYETRKAELFEARSAIRWADQLNTPLLIMHGGADKGVDPAQSLNMAQRLQKLGKLYELIVYAEDGHRLAHNQEDRDRRATGWFKRFIKK